MYNSYHKTPLTTAQQIELLQKRGMVINDTAAAGQTLNHINYYRLSVYWLPFEIKEGSGHTFQQGTTFKAVLNIYHFDRDLRLLLLDAIERVEISFRCRFANVVSLEKGAFAHTEAKYFKKPERWQGGLETLENELKKSKETFVIHHQNKYPNLKYPPLWVACEVMSFGQLSRWFENLAEPQLRQKIAKQYGLDEDTWGSFIHHLTEVRNHCAHHARIWNRKFTKASKQPKELRSVLNPQAPNRIYNTLTLLVYLTKKHTQMPLGPAKSKNYWNAIQP